MKFITILQKGQPSFSINPLQICCIDHNKLLLTLADGKIFEFDQSTYQSVLSYLTTEGLIV